MLLPFCGFLLQIRVEMMKDRALALKSQEERLGAMITSLQMEKAREVGDILNKNVFVCA
jgi:hypothetical protein